MLGSGDDADQSKRTQVDIQLNQSRGVWGYSRVQSFKKYRRNTNRQPCLNVGSSGRNRYLSAYLQSIRQLPNIRKFRLLQAVGLNDTERAEHELKCGTPPNSLLSAGRSALHIAVSKGYSDMVQLLLFHGANPNLLDQLYNTPLHLAVCTGNANIIFALLEAGADVNILNALGRTAIQLATGKLRLLDLLEYDGAINNGNCREALEQFLERVKTKQAIEIELQFNKMSLEGPSDDEIDRKMASILTEMKEVQI